MGKQTRYSNSQPGSNITAVTTYVGEGFGVLGPRFDVVMFTGDIRQMPLKHLANFLNDVTGNDQSIRRINRDLEEKIYDDFKDVLKLNDDVYTYTGLQTTEQYSEWTEKYKKFSSPLSLNQVMLNKQYLKPVQENSKPLVKVSQKEKLGLNPSEKLKECQTHNQLKIWFENPNSSEPLGGIENEIRLMRARELFPKHNIRLVYEPKNLTEAAKIKLKSFCEKNNIQLFSLGDIEAELMNACNHAQNDENLEIELKLLEIAQKECQSDFGNLAAASDIVRLLSSALRVRRDAHESRMYIDFDETLSKDLPDTIQLRENDLLKAAFGNCFLFPGSVNANVLLTVRKAILANYHHENLFNNMETAYQMATKYVAKNLSGPENCVPAMLCPSKNSEEFCKVNDIFSLRQALLVKSKSLPDIEKAFYHKLYIELVIHMSGPEAFALKEFHQAKDDTTAFNIRESFNDFSWCKWTVFYEKEERAKMHNAAIKINSFLSHRQGSQSRVIDTFNPKILGSGESAPTGKYTIGSELDRNPNQEEDLESAEEDLESTKKALESAKAKARRKCVIM